MRQHRIKEREEGTEDTAIIYLYLMPFENPTIQDLSIPLLV